MLKLKTFRKNIKGLADLLVYGRMVSDTVICNKDGSFLTMYQYIGNDTASSTNAELNNMAEMVNSGLLSFGDGWMAHVYANRTENTFYPAREASHFPDPISKMIDEERREFFQGKTCFNTDQYLCLTFLPNYNAEKLIAHASGSAREQNLEETLKYFETSLRNFEDKFSSVLNLERLGTYTLHEKDRYDNVTPVKYSDLLSVIHALITGIYQPIKLPDCPMYLDALLPSQNLYGGLTPRIGDKYIAALSIDGLPNASYPAMLEKLEHLPLEFSFCTRFIFLDKRTADKELDSYQNAWNQKTVSFLNRIFPSKNPKVNEHAFQMVADAKEARAELESDDVAFGYLTSTVILTNPDLSVLEDSTREVAKVFQTLGFPCRVESINTLEAWLGTHPGNGFANVRRPLVHTYNLSHLLPLATIWHGRTLNPNPLYPAKSPCLAVLVTDGNSQFYFNPHVGDLGHMFIVGTTGSGKSALLTLMAMQFRRYQNASIFAFDVKNSMEITCHAAGGKHFDIGRSGSKLAFAPLRDVDKSAAELTWAIEWVENLIYLQSEKQITPKQRMALTDSMKLLATQPPEHRALLHLLNLVKPKDSELADALRHYTRDGSMGNLLDASEDGLTLSDFTVFELEELMALGEKNILPVILYLFHRIENSLLGHPTVIFIDEASVTLGHPIFQKKINSWLKMMRSKNCIVVMATQQLTDAVKSEIMDVIIESCPTKIYLPNHEATNNETIRKIYLKQGLNETELQIIARARPKREYYIKSWEGCRLVNLQLGQKTLAFIGRSSKEHQAEVHRLMSEYPKTWRSEWLASQTGIREELA
ncbi:MAG: conjugal transfer protein TrbE [Deltaproteobacteria bacterium]|jgi:type IV secretion system protein VirB4|nr:conjugal transfer protein TrbE [Deltaproteobacteria bacterium]